MQLNKNQFYQQKENRKVDKRYPNHWSDPIKIEQLFFLLF